MSSFVPSPHDPATPPPVGFKVIYPQASLADGGVLFVWLDPDDEMKASCEQSGAHVVYKRGGAWYHVEISPKQFTDWDGWLRIMAGEDGLKCLWEVFFRPACGAADGRCKLVIKCSHFVPQLPAE